VRRKDGLTVHPRAVVGIGKKEEQEGEGLYDREWADPKKEGHMRSQNPILQPGRGEIEGKRSWRGSPSHRTEGQVSAGVSQSIMPLAPTSRLEENPWTVEKTIRRTQGKKSPEEGCRNQ